MKISVVGAGYVGLVQAAGLAHICGHQVLCVDKDMARIDRIKQSGKAPFYEPELDDWIDEEYRKNYRLSFGTTLKQAIEYANIIFICVGTPQGENGAADLSALEGIAEGIKQYNCLDKIFVTKSTVPPGTGRRLFGEMSRQNRISDYVSNPEFLREGTACHDFRNPDRIIVGSQQMSMNYGFDEIYKNINVQPVYTTTEEAEMIKYASNAFLAMKISYAHEIQEIANAYDCDPMVVLRSVGEDKRIGPMFLHPGVGYGGSCFPKDTEALKFISEIKGIDPFMINATIDRNDRQVSLIVKKVEDLIVRNKLTRVGILGLTFKADTDDIRESAAIKILDRLALNNHDVQFIAHDPMGIKHAAKRARTLNITFEENLQAVANNTSLWVILTMWDQYKELNKSIDILPRVPVTILDCRNDDTLRSLCFSLNARMGTQFGYMRIGDVKNAS